MVMVEESKGQIRDRDCMIIKKNGCRQYKGKDDATTGLDAECWRREKNRDLFYVFKFSQGV